VEPPEGLGRAGWRDQAMVFSKRREENISAPTKADRRAERKGG
jgi:hypothetical protein